MVKVNKETEKALLETFNSLLKMGDYVARDTLKEFLKKMPDGELIFKSEDK